MKKHFCATAWALALLCSSPVWALTTDTPSTPAATTKTDAIKKTDTTTKPAATEEEGAIDETFFAP